ncbi:MAG: DNA-binding transcriptional regulator, partial [Umezawaea sp.]
KDLPGGDAAAHVARGVAQRWPYQATLRLHCSADSGPARDAGTYGRIEPIDAHTCRLHIGAENPRALVFLLGALDVDFDIEDAPELAQRLRHTADRYHRALHQDVPPQR